MPSNALLYQYICVGCAENETVLRWNDDPGESVVLNSKTLAEVAATRVITAFNDGSFEFAHRSVQVCSVW